MRSSIDESFARLQGLTHMSAQGPSNPLGNRPRMAEALASLKEGLRDTADPLYDGWKLRPRAPEPNPPVQHPPRLIYPASEFSDGPLADTGDTIDITIDGAPDKVSLTDAEPETPRLGGDSDPGTPRFDDWSADDLPTQEQLIEALNEEAAPAAQRRPSVQTDTVRVRIIRYQPFPRWALVAVAALLVFAVSVVVLRASFLRQSARSTRSVLTTETAPNLTASKTDRPRFAASNAAVAAPPPSLVMPAGSAARSSSPIAQAVPTAATRLEPSSRSPTTTQSLPMSASAPAPAVKIPSSSQKRRAGGQEFFRDPGF
jgi:hypothetical protein